MTTKQKAILIIILALAAFFRFYLIGQMPGGLFPDEAANGLDINSMQQGHLQPFYERGNGREALFFYMLWGSVEIFGKGPWQHHIVSALVGFLSVFVCFLLTRRLLMQGEDLANKDKWHRATNIALLAAFLMAVSSWYVVLSRTAFRANLIPLFSGLTFYFLLATFQSLKNRTFVRKGKFEFTMPARLRPDYLKMSGESEKGLQLIPSHATYWYALLTGAAFALGFYTYIAYRILVPIVGILVLWPFAVDLFSRPRLQYASRFWKAGIVALLAFIVFIYPLGHYFYTHPGSFVGRSGQVSVFNPELNQGNLMGAVATVAKLSVLAYFTEGDLNWRHNVSGEPFLSPLVSPFFGVALVVITLLAAVYMLSPKKRSKWWKYAMLAGWFWGMLIPVVTTAEGIPHGLRSIGTIPPVFIISAIGLYTFVELLNRLHRRLHNFHEGDMRTLRMSVVSGAFFLLGLCFFGALVAQTYSVYFVAAANSPENYYAFRSDLTSTSKYLIERCEKDSTYLVLDKFSVQTPDYITMVDDRNLQNPCNQPYRQVDPENAWELSGLKPGDMVVFTQSSIFDITKFKQYHKNTRLVRYDTNQFGQTIMAVYEVMDNR